MHAHGCQWTNVVQLGEKGKVIIINSNEELEDYYANCQEVDNILNSIDFSKYTLLLAQGLAPGLKTYFSAEDNKLPLPKLQQLSTNKYILNIEIRKSNEKDSSQPWSRALIVDKLSDKSIVDLDETILIEEYEWYVTHDESASIIGKWKLVIEEDKFQICPAGGIGLRNYSQYNIIYEFKPNGIVTITNENGFGPIASERSYSFIDYLDYWYGKVPVLDIINDRMYLYSISSEHLRLEIYGVSKSFIRYFVKIN